jgi:hypothetical protein
MRSIAHATVRFLSIFAIASIPVNAIADTDTANIAATYYAPAIGALADDIEKDYVFPDKGHLYAALLRQNLKDGVYRGITDPAAIGQRLTDDLRGASHDLHFRVRPVAGTTTATPSTPPRPPIEDVKWLADGVAYIRFNFFADTPETVAATEKFMQDHATAKAIIVDSRHNHGGGGGETNAMLPYLFAAKTSLVDMELSDDTARSQGFTEDQFFRQVQAPPGHVRFEQVVEPNSTEHRLFASKVYYLTSLDTGSAAEALAFIFKITHRATIVGERTRGMDHFGRFMPLPQSLECFMSLGRTFDPATGADWEGGGVAPDVAVPPDEALDIALKMAEH